MAKTEELLKVLDLPKEEQRIKIAEHIDWVSNWHKIKSVCRRSPLRGELPELWVLVCEWCHKEWEHPTLTQIPEQDREFIRKINEEEPCKRGRYEGSLPDLAFRLRDEVEKSIGDYWFGRGMAKICNKIYGAEHSLSEFLSWGLVLAKPIHWVIAALIAKELSKASEEKDNGQIPNTQNTTY